MRTAVLASTVSAGAALLWATTSHAGTSWLPALWVPWLIVTIYAWSNYRPSTSR